MSGHKVTPVSRRHVIPKIIVEMNIDPFKKPIKMACNLDSEDWLEVLGSDPIDRSAPHKMHYFLNTPIRDAERLKNLRRILADEIAIKIADSIVKSLAEGDTVDGYRSDEL